MDTYVVSKRPPGLPSKALGPIESYLGIPPTHDRDSPLTGYLVEKSEGHRPWTEVDKISPDLTEFQLKGVTESTNYSRPSESRQSSNKETESH